MGNNSKEHIEAFVGAVPIAYVDFLGIAEGNA